jgi:hypothetical protein
MLLLLSIYTAAVNLLQLAGHSCSNMHQLQLNSYAVICNFASTAGCPLFLFLVTVFVRPLQLDKKTQC